MIARSPSPISSPKVYYKTWNAWANYTVVKSAGRGDVPVKCLIFASFLVPDSARISVACMPCKSSTVWVSKIFFAPVVWAAFWAGESWWRAEVDERDLWKILGEHEHSWRRSIVDAIEGCGALCGRRRKVGRFGSEVAARVQSAFG